MIQKREGLTFHGGSVRGRSFHQKSSSLRGHKGVVAGPLSSSRVSEERFDLERLDLVPEDLGSVAHFEVRFVRVAGSPVDQGSVFGPGSGVLCFSAGTPGSVSSFELDAADSLGGMKEAKARWLAQSAWKWLIQHREMRWWYKVKGKPHTPGWGWGLSRIVTVCNAGPGSPLLLDVERHR